MKPLCIDLFCGLGGWAEGFLAEGYDVIGFDIERRPYPGQLVLQDVMALHGSQFRNATVIVASPPCQAYSYRAMPWKRAKALPPPSNELFDACFRIQREANEALGGYSLHCGVFHPATRLDGCDYASRYIPLVVENVRGAERWVGPAKWKYKSFHLWGDVPAMMPIPDKGFKGFKTNWRDCEASRRWSSHSPQRKAWSAQIAKIPFDLANHIARVYRPDAAPTNSVCNWRRTTRLWRSLPKTGLK